MKRIKDLQVFDDVFVVLKCKVYKSWVMNKSDKLLQIYVWDTYQEILINISKNLDDDVLQFGRNNWLILNKKDICDYL